jgi:organic hydroperoxide reductase OsmC/OhrA
MSTYHATIRWTRGEQEFAHQHYSRGHTWHFDEGIAVPASASPHVVRAPWAVAAAVDPEEAFVASLSSCHMLFFLSYCSRDGFIVESYEDAASGVLEKGPSGKIVMTSVTIRPVVTFRGALPTQAQFDAWQHQAHEECYIANSVTSTVNVEASYRSV